MMTTRTRWMTAIGLILGPMALGCASSPTLPPAEHPGWRKAANLLIVPVSAAADDDVPNHIGVVRDVLKAGHYDLLTHEGRASFVDAAVEALHKKDKRWGHLKKKSSQTHIHLHAEDAALYLADDGLSSSVDFGGGFGGPTPTIAWQVDQPRYTKADWLDPHEHDAWANPAPAPPPVPVVKPYPGDAFFIEQIGVILQSDYADAGQSLNAGSVVWISRTIWRYVNEGMTIEQSTKQSRLEWRAALGLPPVP